jgi:hypothetical protein
VAHVVEGGVMEVSLTGYRGEHPPATLPGFVAHAAALARPDIHRLIQDATPCSDLAQFRIARTVRRDYHKLRRWPAGLLAIGDSICAFNPVFAQGMTVAALGALALRDEIARTRPGPPDAAFSRRFFRCIARELEPAWQMARSSDLMAPHLAHRASLPDRLMARWIGRVLAAGAGDAHVAGRFKRVASLVDSPASLLAPGLVLRVLSSGAATGERAAQGRPRPAAARLDATEERR